MDLLDRLYDRLADAARREYPGASAPTITIAEVYQSLIPYRGVRTELGILELAQYEHALLRLLSGERRYAEIELPQVAEELQRELATTNPILGIYRDYAAVPIRLRLASPESPIAVPQQRDASAAGVAAADRETERPNAGRPEASEAETVPFPTLWSEDRRVPRALAESEEAEMDRARAPAEPEPEMQRARPPAARHPTEPQPPPPAAVRSDVSRPQVLRAADSAMEQAEPACSSCGERLPDEPDVRFCPLCGAGQEPVPCTRCGGHLRAEWNFCIRCGTPRPSSIPSA